MNLDFHLRLFMPSAVRVTFPDRAGVCTSNQHNGQEAYTPSLSRAVQAVVCEIGDLLSTRRLQQLAASRVELNCNTKHTGVQRVHGRLTQTRTQHQKSPNAAMKPTSSLKLRSSRFAVELLGTATSTSNIACFALLQASCRIEAFA